MTLLMLQLESASIAPAAGRHAEPLALSFDQRKRSRLRMTLADGREIAWALAAGQVLRPGDCLRAARGACFEVSAVAEMLLRITASTPQALTRAAYHLGNRHVAVEVGAQHLAIERDPVLRDMLSQLGVQVEEVETAFLPETGAYGGGHKHGHDETFAADHALSQQLYVLRGPTHAGGSPLIEPHHSHEHPHSHSNDHSHGHRLQRLQPTAVGHVVDDRHGHAAAMPGQRALDDDLE